MSVYQCLVCLNLHGYHPVFKFREIDQKRNQRYDDCNIYHCPYCDTILDTRDITPFFGCRGRGTLREIKQKELRDAIEYFKLKYPEGECGDANMILEEFVHPMFIEDGMYGMKMISFQDDSSDDE